MVQAVSPSGATTLSAPVFFVGGGRLLEVGGELLVVGNAGAGGQAAVVNTSTVSIGQVTGFPQIPYDTGSVLLAHSASYSYVGTYGASGTSMALAAIGTSGLRWEMGLGSNQAFSAALVGSTLWVTESGPSGYSLVSFNASTGAKLSSFGINSLLASGKQPSWLSGVIPEDLVASGSNLLMGLSSGAVIVIDPVAHKILHVVADSTVTQYRPLSVAGITVSGGLAYVVFGYSGQLEIFNPSTGQVVADDNAQALGLTNPSSIAVVGSSLVVVEGVDLDLLAL